MCAFISVLIIYNRKNVLLEKTKNKTKIKIWKPVEPGLGYKAGVTPRRLVIEVVIKNASR